MKPHQVHLEALSNLKTDLVQRAHRLFAEEGIGFTGPIGQFTNTELLDLWARDAEAAVARRPACPERIVAASHLVRALANLEALFEEPFPNDPGALANHLAKYIMTAGALGHASCLSGLAGHGLFDVPHKHRKDRKRGAEGSNAKRSAWRDPAFVFYADEKIKAPDARGKTHSYEAANRLLILGRADLTGDDTAGVFEKRIPPAIRANRPRFAAIEAAVKTIKAKTPSLCDPDLLAQVFAELK